MINEKSTTDERPEYIALLEKLENGRVLMAEDTLTGERYTVTKVRLFGDRVIFNFEGKNGTNASESTATSRCTK